MVKYGDYFSRKVLYHCGVSPDKALFQNGETAYTGTERIAKIRSDMSEIYQTLSLGYASKNDPSKQGEFEDLHVESKIVSAFYDAGVLDKAEREYFQTQSIQAVEEREKISVGEADLSLGTATSQKVETPSKMPIVRDIPQ